MAMKVIPAAQAELLKKINSVEGFDPEAFTTEYTDMNSGETRKHLPVMAQMAWFRLKFPEGKIAVSAREWAQTAAVGIALRNAGFGLQFGTAGDDFTSQHPNEFPTAVPAELPDNTIGASEFSSAVVAQPVQAVQVQKELTPEEKYLQACAVIWPTKKHSGRTLGEVLQMDPTAITWLANKYMGNQEASAAAKFMCEYALNGAGA